MTPVPDIAERVGKILNLGLPTSARSDEAYSLAKAAYDAGRDVEAQWWAQRIKTLEAKIERVREVCG